MVGVIHGVAGRHWSDRWPPFCCKYIGY
jgi:hypothetical protein